jgi:hypothetical protein
MTSVMGYGFQGQGHVALGACVACGAGVVVNHAKAARSTTPSFSATGARKKLDERFEICDLLVSLLTCRHER